MSKKYFNSGRAYEVENIEFSLEGYVIVVPEGNEAVKKSAELLKGYFSAQGAELDIVSDLTEPVEREVLVGETNRVERKKRLKEGMVVSEITEDGKLLITGGHPVTVESAVKRFIRLKKNEGEIEFPSEVDEK